MQKSTRIFVRLLLILSALGVVTTSSPTQARDVFPDAASARPLQSGATVPSVEVKTLGGEAVDLAAITRESGALLVFYRGGW